MHHYLPLWSEKTFYNNRILISNAVESWGGGSDQSAKLEVGSRTFRFGFPVTVSNRVLSLAL